MLAVPQAGLLITPDGLIIATEGLPLVHEPPVGRQFTVVVPPSLKVSTPVIAPGSGFMVTTTVRVQPEPTV